MAKSVSSFKLFFNRDSQVGLPSQYEGTELGSKWLLKKKSADLSSNCQPTVDVAGWYFMLAVASNGTKECYSGVWFGEGADATKLKPMFSIGEKVGSDYVRTAVDMSAYMQDGRSYSQFPQAHYSSSLGKFVSAAVSVDASSVTHYEKFDVDPTSLAVSNTAITLGSAIPYSLAGIDPLVEKAGVAYLIARTSPISNIQYTVLNLTANTAATYSMPSPWQGGPVWWGFQPKESGDLLIPTVSTSPGGNYSISRIFTVDPSSGATVGSHVNLSRPGDLGAGMVNGMSLNSDAHFVHLALTGGGSKLEALSYDLSSGALIDRADVDAAWGGVNNMHRENNAQRMSTSEAFLMTQKLGRGTTYSVKCSLDGSGNITVASDKNIRQGTALRTVKEAYNATHNLLFELTSINNPRNPIIRSGATAKEDLSINIPVDIAQLSKPLADLKLSALFPAMYIPSQESAATLKNLSVLVSKFTGGRFDGGVPSKGNFLINIKDDVDGNGFEVAATHDVVAVDSSCVLSAPGTIIEFMHIEL